MTNQEPKTSGPIIYGLALSTPEHVVDRLAAALTRYQRRIGTRWRARKQAILTIAWLEGGHTYRSLGQGNGVPKSTCRTMIQEGIKVLARRALPLTEVVHPLARKAGWDYLIVDGSTSPPNASPPTTPASSTGTAASTAVTAAAVQTVAAPTESCCGVSGVLPGKTVDITAARRFGIAEKVLRFLGLLADLGLHRPAPTGDHRIQTKRGEKTLPEAKKAANRAQASLRCIGERANSQLKQWRVLTCDFRGHPRQLTAIVKAIQALQYLIGDPFGAAGIDTGS